MALFSIVFMRLILQKPLTKYFIAVLVILVLCFLSRNSALQFAFKKAQTYSLVNYDVILNASSIRFSGFYNIELKDVTLQPQGADTFVRVAEVSLNLSLLDLLTAKIGFDEVKVHNALITAYHQPERNNLRFLNSIGKTKATSTAASKTNYRKLALNLKSKLVRAFNTAFELENIQLLYQDSAASENVLIPLIRYDLVILSGSVINQTLHDTITLSGKVLDRNKSYHFEAQHNNVAAYLPFLNREHSLKCSFKSITASLDFENGSNELQITTNVQTENFHFNHWRLANDDVVFEHAEFTGQLNVRNDAVELDSSSTIKFKNVTTQLFANYHVQPNAVFTAHVHIPETVSDTFFHGLPQGMFNTLKGISCTGSLVYDLFFQINAQQPDSLVFNSSLTRKNFSIKHYGAENYTRMNEPFTYQAYDKDRFVRKIEISSANPYFTPLNRISDYLVKSVLQSEDPSFMLHRGFLPESFRESIIKNYKERRFARGGSTISMQLVKNVFLSRDKTISRKAEEALIVYLIENLRLVPKERMLEIYLNVIEWGPNVYGIGEASRFYFSKSPSELTLQESIFLAGIIPRPKYFKYQFDAAGNLKPYLSDYFRILAGRMDFKGWITPVDTSGFLPNVKLKGAALRMVVPSDTVIMPEEEELP